MTTEDSAPDPIDVAVGARIRLRRQVLSVSQTALAEALGVSFQQVQKYERGVNRISASMLVRTAEKLQCSVAHLVGEEEGGIMDAGLLSLLATPGAIPLLDAYAKIPDGETRSAAITLLRGLSSHGAESGRRRAGR